MNLDEYLTQPMPNTNLDSYRRLYPPAPVAQEPLAPRCWECGHPEGPHTYSGCQQAVDVAPSRQLDGSKCGCELWTPDAPQDPDVSRCGNIECQGCEQDDPAPVVAQEPADPRFQAMRQVAADLFFFGSAADIYPDDATAALETLDAADRAAGYVRVKAEQIEFALLHIKNGHFQTARAVLEALVTP